LQRVPAHPRRTYICLMHIAMGGKSDREHFDPLALGLADIFQRLDPIGVFCGETPSDDPTEYDDLVIPTLWMLKSGVGVVRLTRELRQVLISDYGLSDPPSTFGVARACIAWWKASKSVQRSESSSPGL
jgi:hypothetical protein